jgi:hypothetical protein
MRKENERAEGAKSEEDTGGIPATKDESMPEEKCDKPGGEEDAQLHRVGTVGHHPADQAVVHLSCDLCRTSVMIR